VHAWGQVASYRHEAVDPARLNSLLPKDISVLSCEPAQPGFDARRDATSRTYCYRVLNRSSPSPQHRASVLWWPRPVDLEALAQCAEALVGSHDFTAFTPTETDHVRFERDILGASWREQHGVLEFWIEADTFMRHMNRVLVGTMLEVSMRRRTVDDFRRLLQGAPRDQAGPTAPAHGLALASVSYR
jgi:tRNA pseudouridine38-40 synthase